MKPLLNERNIPNAGSDPTETILPGISESADSSFAEKLRDEVILALKTVYDPEIPVDIYELGLIYKIEVQEDGRVAIDMTLTTPGCPVAGSMPGMVQQAVAAVDGVQDVDVALVWDPPWHQSRMTEVARLELGLF